MPPAACRLEKPDVKGLHFVIACTGRRKRQAGRARQAFSPARQKSAEKVNRNFSVITLDMICGGLYNGPACMDAVKDAESQGGAVASRSESPRRPATECRESALKRRKEPDLECRERIRRRRNFTHDGSVGFGVVVLWGRPGREAGADRGCDVGEGRSPFPPAPCRQDGGLTTVGFLGLRVGSGLKL